MDADVPVQIYMDLEYHYVELFDVHCSISAYILFKIIYFPSLGAIWSDAFWNYFCKQFVMYENLHVCYSYLKEETSFLCYTILIWNHFKHSKWEWLGDYHEIKCIFTNHIYILLHIIVFQLTLQLISGLWAFSKLKLIEEKHMPQINWNLDLVSPETKGKITQISNTEDRRFFFLAFIIITSIEKIREELESHLGHLIVFTSFVGLYACNFLKKSTN